jgi:hypothetical protein
MFKEVVDCFSTPTSFVIWLQFSAGRECLISYSIKLIRQSRPPEDDNHMPKHAGVEKIWNVLIKKITNSMRICWYFYKRYYNMLGSTVKRDVQSFTNGEFRYTDTFRLKKPFFKKVRKWRSNSFEKTRGFLFAGRKVQWDEGGRKNTAGRQHRRWGFHVAADQVPVYWISVSSWTPFYVEVYVTILLLNTELRQILRAVTFR